MAWIVVNGLFDLTDRSGSVPWHILQGETVRVPTRREMALHGELLLEGALQLEGTARLRMEL